LVERVGQRRPGCAVARLPVLRIAGTSPFVTRHHPDLTPALSPAEPAVIAVDVRALGMSADRPSLPS
jgi:hypothetical protein